MADVTSLVGEWVGAWVRGTQAARDVATASALAAQRQWQTGLDIASEAVERVFSPENLSKARNADLTKSLREAAHQSVNLAVDIGALYVATMSQATESLMKDLPAAAAANLSKSDSHKARSRPKEQK